MAKQDDYTRYTIRIPTPLYERVKAAAGEASVNAEIAATLERAYPEPPKLDPRLVGMFLEAIRAAGVDDPEDPRFKEVIDKASAQWAEAASELRKKDRPKYFRRDDPPHGQPKE